MTVVEVQVGSAGQNTPQYLPGNEGGTGRRAGAESLMATLIPRFQADVKARRFERWDLHLDGHREMGGEGNKAPRPWLSDGGAVTSENGPGATRAAGGRRPTRGLVPEPPEGNWIQGERYQSRRRRERRGRIGIRSSLGFRRPRASDGQRPLA